MIDDSHMTGILDSMMARPRSFVPESVAEYIALQLAKKLNDTERISTYLSLVDRYSMQVILEALAGAKATDLSGTELIVAFERSLSELTSHDDEDEF